jgi:exosortase/archaeosortase family protein
MTVAIAALCYVITLLGRGRPRTARVHRAMPLGLVLHLTLMMLLVIPAAILANATRVAAMAWVMDRYRLESYTAWAHDFGDWLVLPSQPSCS